MNAHYKMHFRFVLIQLFVRTRKISSNDIEVHVCSEDSSTIARWCLQWNARNINRINENNAHISAVLRVGTGAIKEISPGVKIAFNHTKCVNTLDTC